MKKFIAAMVLVLGMSVAVYAEDAVIGPGKRVKIEYTLFANNEQIETSVGHEPMEYTVGDQTIIPGLESQLNGMHVGEEKVIEVEAKDAYGEVDPKAVKEFPKTSLPKGVEPKVGMVLQATAPDGEDFPATIKEIKDDQVVLDFNHPLAGKPLKFNVKVLDIQNAPIPAPTPAPDAAAPDAAAAPAAAEPTPTAPAVVNSEK